MDHFSDPPLPESKSSIALQLKMINSKLIRIKKLPVPNQSAHAQVVAFRLRVG